jgi:hypothetical protein
MDVEESTVAADKPVYVRDAKLDAWMAERRLDAREAWQGSLAATEDLMVAAELERDRRIDRQLAKRTDGIGRMYRQARGRRRIQEEHS